MGYIVLSFSSCSLYALCHQFSQALEGTRLGAISPVLGGNRRNRKMVSLSENLPSIVFTTPSVPSKGQGM